jgi:hypothetical protein
MKAMLFLGSIGYLINGWTGVAWGIIFALIFRNFKVEFYPEKSDKEITK